MIKQSTRDLAIFGGSPRFTNTVHVGCPNIGNRQRLFSRFEEILDRNWLTNEGPCVREFEARIAERLAVRNCIVVCNGTTAMLLTLRALGLQGEVIVPSFTFVATVHALEWQGIEPVFCDVEPEQLTLNPALVEPLLTDRTTGILAVHLWGRPARVEQLGEIAERHGLQLVYDAAHAFDCTFRGLQIGNFGNAEVFSFHATKFVHSFEGGAILTNEDDLAARLRCMKNFGFTGTDQVSSIGINGKLSEVAAAMGLTSLESIEETIDTNRRNYERYRSELSGIPGVRLRLFDETEQCNYQYITIDFDEQTSGITRDLFAEILTREKIRVRRYFYPGVHNMEPYRSRYPGVGERLPATERAARQTLCLPTGTSVSENDIADICAIIRFVVAHAEPIVELVGETHSRLIRAQ